MTTTTENPLKSLILHLLNGRLRQATVARAEANDEVTALGPHLKGVIDKWLGTGRGNAEARATLKGLLGKNRSL